MISKKKKFVFIIVAILLITAAAGIVLFIDHNKVFRVDGGYLYSEGSYIAVNNNVSKNRSIASGLFYSHRFAYGSSVAYIEKNGNTGTIIDLYDGIISDVYIYNNHLYVVYYQGFELYKDSGRLTRQLAEFDLSDLNHCKISELPDGNIIGMNTQTGKWIARSDLRLDFELRSNCLYTDSGIYYIDGKQLVLFNGTDYEALYSFKEGYNYTQLYLAGYHLYAVCSEGYAMTTVNVYDIKDGSLKPSFEIREDIVGACTDGERLYLLTTTALIGIDHGGAANGILSLDKERSESFRAVSKAEGGGIAVFTSERFIMIDSSGEAVSERKYARPVTVDWIAEN